MDRFRLLSKAAPVIGATVVVGAASAGFGNIFATWLPVALAGLVGLVATILLGGLGAGMGGLAWRHGRHQLQPIADNIYGGGHVRIRGERPEQPASLRRADVGSLAARVLVVLALGAALVVGAASASSAQHGPPVVVPQTVSAGPFTGTPERLVCTLHPHHCHVVHG